MQGWYYVKSLTGQRHDRVQTESQQLQPWTAVSTLLGHPAFTGSIFVCGPLHHHVSPYSTVKYGPQNWPITAHVLTERYNKKFLKNVHALFLIYRIPPPPPPQFLCMTTSIVQTYPRASFSRILLKPLAPSSLLFFSVHAWVVSSFLVWCLWWSCQNSVIVGHYEIYPRGVLDISLGGEVRRGPSYPDPV